MYTGALKKLRLTRSVCCSECQGKGGQQVAPCAPCQGRGVRVVVQRLGPGMISQSQQTCPACRGEGQVIAAGKECKSCVGAKIVKEKKQLDVNVPPGARAGQTIVFPSQGDQTPGNLPGDIIVQFEEKPHDRFLRKGHHIYYRQRITLLEALVGFTFYINHLDGHEVKVQSTTVLKPGDVMCIPDEGFPHSFGNGRGIDVGNLYITFDIEFPTTQMIQSKPNAVNSLKQALPNNSSLRTAQPKGVKVTATAASVTDMETENRKHAREEQEWKRFKDQQDRTQQAQSSYDDDDDDHYHGGAQPACQQL
eukprot:UN01737